jgi:predicted ATP-grasp superfamily ATP-dependent carboligase
VPAAAAREGRKWVVEDHDLLSLLGYRRDGGLELRKWAASLRGVREAAYFAADDPLPLLAMCANDARTALQRFRAPAAGRLQTPAAGPLGASPASVSSAVARFAPAPRPPNA